MKTMVRTRLFALLFVLSGLYFLFAGCSGGGGGSAGAPASGSSGVSTDKPVISVSSTAITSENVIMNTAVDQPVIVRNTGSATLSLGSIAGGNPLSAPFSIVNDDCSNKWVAASGSCTFSVRFMPTAENAFSDSFDIPSNASNTASVTVNVSGSSRSLRVIINQVRTDYCGTGELELHVSVMDRFNNPVAGLAAGDFQVRENGSASALLSVSTSSASAPLSVAQVLDYSTSLNDDITDIEAAASGFVGLMSAGDEAAIVKFAESAQVMQEFTTDKTALAAAVGSYPTAIGSREETHLYDTLWSVTGVTALRSNNRLIVLLSDGIDEDVNNVPNASVKSLDEAIAHAVANHVAIFTVGLGLTNGVVMNQLAAETGGQYFYAPTSGQLPAIYGTIRALVSGEYIVRYASGVQGVPVGVRVQVTTPDGTGVAARTLDGCP